jgi:hypothetical protein
MVTHFVESVVMQSDLANSFSLEFLSLGCLLKLQGMAFFWTHLCWSANTNF